MVPMFDGVLVPGIVGSVVSIALLGGLSTGVFAGLVWLIVRSADEALRRQASRDWEARRAVAPARLAA
jgi:hypothetical protein